MSFMVSMVVLFTAGVSWASDDLVFRCKGTISGFWPTLWTRENEEIAARISDRATISFSGNDFLKGRSIRICRDSDDVYFDSDTCGGVTTTHTRQYGEFNRILKRLVLTNTTDRSGVIGHFNCERVPIR